jgi:hypothetical protein
MMRNLFPLVALFAVGCGPTAPTPTGDAPKPTGTAAHTHGESGPSGGVLASWGKEEYHAEFTVDHPTGEATVYLLDGTAKKVTAIDAKSITLSLKETPPVVLTLTAKPQDGDPPGQSSRFVGTHEVLKTVKEFRGSISGTASGKNYTGDFEEKPSKN